MLTLPFSSSPNNALQNPRLPIQSRPFAALNCKGVRLTIPSHCYPARGDHTTGGPAVALKTADVATLGNLCVDLVLNVPELPPASFLQRKAYMERLAASPPDKVSIAQSSLFSVLFIFPFPLGLSASISFFLFFFFSCFPLEFTYEEIVASMNKKAHFYWNSY